MKITQVPSPNFDTNRKPIKKVVIHWFGQGNLASADRTFKSPGGTSAHYAVADSIIHQYVKEEHTAYHCGHYVTNQESIGIEHFANTTMNASEETYKTSAALISEICKRHNIPLDRQHIIKHSEVVPTQCPGTIDIDKLINLAKQPMDNPELLKARIADLEATEKRLKEEKDRAVQEKERQIDALNLRIQEKEKVISEQSEQLLNIRAERDTLFEDYKQAVIDRDKKEELRAKWYTAYQQSEINYETAKKDNIAFRRRISELEKTSYITASNSILLGEVIKRLFGKAP